MTRLLFAMFVAAGLTTAAPAADWPQFLGPNRDSSTAEIVAPWTAPPKVLWKKPVGPAHASPVVANGMVYAFYQPQKEDADALAAYDAVTGERKYEGAFAREKYTPPFGKGPRGTPAVAGGRVFTLGSTGILAAWSAKNCNFLWKVDTLAEFGAKNLFFGVSTSPIVEGDTVMVMVGGKGAGVVGFDVETGKTKWKTSDDASSYASPFAFGTGANRQVVFLTGANLLSLTAAGGTNWAFPFKDNLNESSTTPVKAGELLIGSSVTAGSVALKLAEVGGKITTEKVWAKKELTCYFSTPVVVGKHLYMVTGAATLTNPTVALRCVEAATGKTLWQKEKVGRYHAALVRTGDDKLLVLDDNGYLALLQPDPAGYKELCKSKVCGVTWAHPALVDGKLYLRDNEDLICLDLTKPKD